MLTVERNAVQTPDPRPHRRLVSRIVLVAVAVSGVAVAAGLDGREAGPEVEVVQPRAEDPSPPTSVPVPTTTSPPDTTPTTQTTLPAPAERLTEASRVRLDGIGPVRVGMTLPEASAAAGVPIEVIQTPITTERCAHARPVGGPEHLRFMVVDGKVARVEAGPGITTLSGVGVGSTEAEVLATYPGQVRVEPNPYQGHRGFHTLVYTPNDPAFAPYGLIFETNGERVTSFRAGFAGPVAWIEGCL